MPTSAHPAQVARQRRATMGAFVGTAIEWYDFFIFGTAAALVFGPLFYPDAAPGAGILASFATFWVGFLARPLGGVIFGHFGDRFGRKNTLLVTLFLMGIATTCIGLLPTFAQIGVAAPILLVVLRALQGLAVGGEWAGATLLATENAAPGKRGMAGAWVQQGSPAGSILATLVFLLVGLLDDASFMSWGWRVPFLLSAVLIIIGLIIRLKVEESNDFQRTQQLGVVVKAPIVEVFRKAPMFVLLGVMASIVGISAAFFNNTFLVAWSTTALGMERQVILNVLLVISILQFIWQPLAAKIAEKIGRTPFMLCALVLNLIAIVPLFLAMLSVNPVLIALALSLTIFGGAGYYSLLASFLSDAFPPNVRYTGVALANGLCASLIGGSTPLIAQTILASAGPWGVAVFYAAITIITILGVWGLARIMRTRDERAAALIEPASAAA